MKNKQIDGFWENEIVGGCYLADDKERVAANIAMYDLQIPLNETSASGSAFPDCAIMTIISPPDLYAQILITSESDLSKLTEYDPKPFAPNGNIMQLLQKLKDGIDKLAAVTQLRSKTNE